jgi:nitroreductase
LTDRDADFFLDAMRRRYACKLYDKTSPLTEDEIAYILECARLSPSSFGLEHWHLWAITDSGTKKRLYDACFAQDAVGTASLIVVAAVRRARFYNPESDFISERGSRFPGGLRVFVDDYRGYWNYLEENGLTDGWARAQSYIACANMMTGAAARGLDSCAIEGFDDKKVLAALGLSPDEWQTGIVTVFGHSAETEVREKIRMAAEEIITRV